jgi:medium-chain acyl-[acyl-carrier-protein] hydrolase
MGAVFASQVAIALQNAGAQTPTHLFLSSRQPPDSPSPVAPLSHLDDNSFLNELDSRYGAIPKEIRAAPDVLALLLPALRADIAALEAIEGATCKALPAPVTALGGDEDHLVSEAALTAWRNWAPRGFHSRIFPGGHFYLDACRAAVINEIVDVLNQALNRIEASGDH